MQALGEAVELGVNLDSSPVLDNHNQAGVACYQHGMLLECMVGNQDLGLKPRCYRFGGHMELSVEHILEDCRLKVDWAQVGEGLASGMCRSAQNCSTHSS